MFSCRVRSIHTEHWPLAVTVAKQPCRTSFLDRRRFRSARIGLPRHAPRGQGNLAEIETRQHRPMTISGVIQRELMKGSSLAPAIERRDEQ